MQSQSNEFSPRATVRLFLAVVNQAIADVLENGKEAKEAEQWLLSKDFETLDRLFACARKPVESRLRKAIPENMQNWGYPAGVLVTLSGGRSEVRSQ